MKFKGKTNGIITSSDLNHFSGKLLYWSFVIILFIVAFFSIIPAIWTVLTAFKSSQEIYSEFSFFPKELNWDIIVTRISEAWKALQFGESFFNTVILSIGELVFNIVVCGFGGYVLSKIKPKGHTLIFTLIVWTMMMPSQTRMVPNYISYLHFPFAFDIGGFNLLDTFWPMWLLAGADSFAVLLFKNAFDGLSDAYVEAAKLDGCSNFGVFFKIMLPLVAPILIFQSITVLSNAWSAFFTPMLVLDEKAVLPVRVYRLQYDSSLKMNTYFMGLIISCIPSFIIFAIFQKRILGGITVGGVKG